jgi:pimeloyl-ACP methyl ester carboxylesterase
MKRAMIAACFLMAVVVTASGAEGESAIQTGNKVETGQINAAAFRIEIPANWNKGLVMYCHGYQVVGTPPAAMEAMLRPFRQVFLDRGFAFAQSDYRRQGWAVKEAVEDTEALRRYFVSKYGRPRETYVVGHSMGAVITIATIERYPELYDGAMPLCGPLNPALEGLKERVFDMLVTFEYFFPGTVGSPVEVPADFKFNLSGEEKVKAALRAAPEKAAIFARRYQFATVDEIPGVLSFFKAILKELQQRAGGNPFDNRNTIYSGFDDDAAVNRGVKRYAADARAQEYLLKHYTPTGRIADPVLSVHTTYDQLVPAQYVCAYDTITKIAGRQDLFVVKFVDAKGHCNINPAQTAAAFDALLQWARERKRPVAGELP